MKATGVANCRNVTAAHLAGVRSLNLARSRITVLDKDDLDGLGNLEDLRLNNNYLRELPSEIFSGLSKLKTLWLHQNSLANLPEGVFDDSLDRLEDVRVDPHLKATISFQLTKQRTVVGARMWIRVWLSRALPVSVRVPYTVGGTISKDDYAITFSTPEDGILFKAGERARQISFFFWQDEETLGKSIVLTLGEISQIGLQPSDGGVEDAPRLGAEVLLDRSAERGTHTVNVAYPNEVVDICDRTSQVRDALMKKTGAENCSGVTAADLTNVRQLLFYPSDIPSLQTHDLRGLTNLTDLLLAYTDVSELPEEIFRGLINLEWLSLAVNDLQYLPETVFHGLDSLRVLNVEFNPLGALPEDIFQGLDSLLVLDLKNIGVTRLPKEIFSGLNALETLWLQGNNLNTLPEDIFQDLNSLQVLLLYGNSLKELPGDIFSGLGNLRQLELHENSLTALPEKIFRGLVSLNSLWLNYNPLNKLPESVFSGLNNLNNLFVYPPTELPRGVFDDVLDTLGGNYRVRYHLHSFTFRVRTRTQRGQLEVRPRLKATLGFISSGQRTPEGSTVRIPVRLSRALPVAVRVPYTIGFSGASVGLRGLSPDPDSGLLFPAWVTRQEVSFSLSKDTGIQTDRHLHVTLGKPAEIGLRPSDGRGPDAPYLKTDSLLLRSGQGATHTVTVFDEEPSDREPYCLSLWEGAPCSTAASLPHVLAGPLGESIATTEVVITHKDPAAADCEVAVLFHRGTSSAPAVSFNNQFPDRNLVRTTVSRGGAKVLTLASSDASELTTGAVYVFARSPCTDDSMQVQGRVLLEGRTAGSTEELFTIAAQSQPDWLEHGDCRVLTGMFGNGRNLEIASVTAEPGMTAPYGTRLLFKTFDLKGSFVGRLSGLEVSGAYQSLPPWEFEQATTLQMCLDVPGGADFQLAVTAVGTKASGAKVQYLTEPFVADPEPRVSPSGR